MRGLTLRKITELTGGTYCGPERALDMEITAVTTDSRKVIPGSLFAAMKGGRSDGHDYMAGAFLNGACGCLAERHGMETGPVVLVQSTFEALKRIAGFYRTQFSIPVVGITGSVGKTTAKEMIASVLSQHFRTMRTEKNFNNELGVPLTLFSLREEHQAAVIEMGISHFGEMQRLGALVRPDIAVFTVIGSSHLEFLYDRPGVLRAKAELLEEMPKDGVVLVNGDDDLLRSLRCVQHKVTFGLAPLCDVRAEQVRNLGVEGVACDIVCGTRRVSVEVPAFGEHMVYAALEGAAVGITLGLDDEQIMRGIAEYETVGSRARIVRANGFLVIDDCYNANPTSVLSSLRSMERLPGRKIAVLGDMLELGGDAPCMHRETGAAAGKVCSYVLTCGSLSENTAVGARESGCEAHWYADQEALLSALRILVQPGDTILIKASHGMHFERIAEALEKEDR